MNFLNKFFFIVIILISNFKFLGCANHFDDKYKSEYEAQLSDNRNRLFNERELKEMRIYTPAILLFNTSSLQKEEERQKARKMMEAKGYSFNQENIFFRGESVAIPFETYKHITPRQSYYKDKYIHAIVLNKLDNDYILQTTPEIIVRFAAVQIGKKVKLYGQTLIGASPIPKQDYVVKFNDLELSKLAIHNNAFDVLGSDIIQINSDGRNKDANEFIKYFNCSINNSFKRGDIVIVPRSLSMSKVSNIFTFGIVLNTTDDGKYRVQISIEEAKIYPVEKINKMDLDPSLLEIYFKDQNTQLINQADKMLSDESINFPQDLRKLVIEYLVGPKTLEEFNKEKLFFKDATLPSFNLNNK